ncbi:MAG: AlkA N-terminal domain-containing protein [Burkholderiaceae bacterium]|nr:AlkA N-terminal domain-containing protein [Burkholderiaceae bacterium]
MEKPSTNASAPLDSEACYRALSARDTRFDGVFFTGVKSTGIYCRPVCTVKTPRASSCTFFPNAALAEAAGYRPCLRCRPELAPYALQQNLAYAVWQRIAAGALNGGDLEGLAAQVGLSSRQLRRVLLQHFGVTPVELAQTQRLLFAKKLLQETDLPMTELAFAAGFGSLRRFNALFDQRYGMAPTAVRRQAKKEAKSGDALVLRLAYRPPFDWGEMLRYLAGRAIPGVEAVLADEAAYARSVRIGDAEGWLRVRHLGAKMQLELEVAPQLAPHLMFLLSQVRTQFDLDANPAAIDAHLMHDPLLAAQLKIASGLRVPGTFSVFELAVRAVLGQQVSVAGATTLSGRLVQRFGAAFGTPIAAVTHHFPLAEVLAAASCADIAHIGLPASRAGTIVNLAQFAAAGGMNLNPACNLQQAVEQLKSVRGIGEWTAQYIALRALRFPDAFPAGDLGLQKAAADTTAPNGRLTEKQLLARAADWSPWRGYAALLLWNSLSNKVTA